ncbi:MAG: NAD(P)/FAD-dependent oxidoreductase [Fibrobacteraceae bacterium]|nr:NAD(P)/FAD-dependent oxidoreductase [Fibrobacteraceae bacterium]
MKTAVIIGAGPAGLTAALELLRTTDVKPIVFESNSFVGGISRTAVYKGNRMDIGGHRFFSKSDRVMDWWTNILKLQGAPSRDDLAIGRKMPVYAGGPDPEKEDRVMLVRSRLSRILYTRKLFDYPVSLNAQTIRNLGFWRMAKIGASYLKVCALPKREEKSLEDFMINRFGVELYRTFFRDYTEKVWGIPCNKISADWGAQRIKGLSIAKTVLHAFKALLPQKKGSVRQKDTETSLISEFLYPKLGPGELWETVADEVRKLGGEIRLNAKVSSFEKEANKISAVTVLIDGKEEKFSADYFMSTMPVKDLVADLPDVPENIRRIANGLVYRDFMTVGLLLDSLDIKNPAKPGTPESKLKFVADNWIYVQESDVKLGRIQVFNNWSPYLVSDPSKVWIGLEYFVNEGDEMWNMADKDFIDFAVAELEKINVAKKSAVKDAVLFRVPKTYPAYFGTYKEFGKVRDYLNPMDNLFLMGRNGMHKYNNMDHSMLTAMEAVKCIRENSADKSALWDVNSEEEYHEGKK